MRTPTLTAAIITGLIWGSPAIFAQNSFEPPPLPAPDESPESNGPTDGISESDDLEILTQGPVHEAFGEHRGVSEEVGEVVPKSPPEPIQEIPPDVKPEGENVLWIPGYWAWSPDRSDYIWVSGMWRVAPPGQQWVPGTWVEVDGGYRWMSGFWTSDEQNQLSYLPEPPDSVEEGPSSPSPGEGYFWVPGQWEYQSNTYQWRPGYWAAVQQDWVWVPACYSWTPYGYIYNSGYWDYPPTSRGLLFCPVYSRAYFRNRIYTPAVTIPIGPLLVNLFVRRGCRNYYFGNYYGANYVNAGYYPWISGQRYSRRYYDPMWSYYRSSAGRGTYDRLLGWNNYYQKNPRLRPPSTWTASRALKHSDIDFRHISGTNRESVLRQTVLGRPLSDVARDKTGARRLERLSADQKSRFSRDVQSWRDFERSRARQEQQLGFRGTIDRDGQRQNDTSRRDFDLSKFQHLNRRELQRSPERGERAGQQTGDERSHRSPQTDRFQGRERQSGTQPLGRSNLQDRDRTDQKGVTPNSGRSGNRSNNSNSRPEVRPERGERSRMGERPGSGGQPGINFPGNRQSNPRDLSGRNNNRSDSSKVPSFNGNRSDSRNRTLPGTSSRSISPRGTRTAPSQSVPNRSSIRPSGGREISSGGRSNFSPWNSSRATPSPSNMNRGSFGNSSSAPRSSFQRRSNSGGASASPSRGSFGGRSGRGGSSGGSQKSGR